MSTGNKGRRGFTFIEVMVTLVVLAGGIVFIYRTFFLCVDYLSRISTRLRAEELIDAKIADVSRLYREHGNLSFDPGPDTLSDNTKNKTVEYHYAITYNPVPGYAGMYRMDVGLTWLDKRKSMHIARSAVLAL